MVDRFTNAAKNSCQIPSAFRISPGGRNTVTRDSWVTCPVLRVILEARVRDSRLQSFRQNESTDKDITESLVLSKATLLRNKCITFPSIVIPDRKL